MMSNLNRYSVFRLASVLAVAGALTLGTAAAQDRPVPDTYEATTTGMTPEGLTLKLDVLSWSDAKARADVVAALSQDENVAETLAGLPSAGVVWRGGSAVGHSIKYAFRESLADGSERVTVVVDKPLDAYSFRPWEIPGSSGDAPLAYSVIELTLTPDGNGRGTMAPAAAVAIDAESATVSLSDDTAPAVLTGAHELPKPYWARTSGG